MKGLFVDTGGWMACADLADPAHVRAAAARDTALETGLALVTTDFVVDETLTLLRVRLGRFRQPILTPCIRAGDRTGRNSSMTFQAS